MHPVTSSEIIIAVRTAYGLSENSILGRSRSPQIAYARQVAMYLCRSLLGYSYPRIGKIFVKDHTTVMAACKAVEKRIAADDIARLKLGEIRSQIEHSPVEKPTCIGCVRLEVQLREIRQLLSAVKSLAKSNSVTDASGVG